MILDKVQIELMNIVYKIAVIIYLLIACPGDPKCSDFPSQFGPTTYCMLSPATQSCKTYAVS